MTKEELETIKQAYKIMNKEINSKKYRCEEYCFGCCQCAFTRFMEDFKSIVDEYLSDSIKFKKKLNK